MLLTTLHGTRVYPGHLNHGHLTLPTWTQAGWSRSWLYVTPVWIKGPEGNHLALAWGFGKPDGRGREWSGGETATFPGPLIQNSGYSDEDGSVSLPGAALAPWGAADLCQAVLHLPTAGNNQGVVRHVVGDGGAGWLLWEAFSLSNNATTP